MEQSEQLTQRQALSKKLWERINERGDFPLLSDSLRSTISAMADDEYDFTTLVQIVLSDFALTQRVIRLANSAMYITFGGNITSISRALVILGVEAVAHLVLGLKLVDHFEQAQERLQHIDAKLELNRTVLAGSVARKVGENARNLESLQREEAVVSSYMRQLGKLLCVFYLESEWTAIRELATATQRSEEDVAQEVLGVTFDDIGSEVAEQWGLPPSIRRSMQTFDPSETLPPEASVEAQHQRWVQAVASFSASVAQKLTMPGADVDQRSKGVYESVQRYAPALAMTPTMLFDTMSALSQDQASQRIIKDIDELHAESEEATGSNPEDVLREGLGELRALSAPEQHLGPVLALAAETILAGMQFTRTVVFVNDPRSHTFEAKLGFGAGVQQILPDLRFDEAFSVDVFHLAISNSVGIFIENSFDKKFSVHVPNWFRKAVPDAYAFVLLPVRGDNNTMALVYGDWNRATLARKISPGEMSVLNELAHELGRFFGQTRVHVA